MDYQITKEIRIHNDDGWFYQFTDDGEGCIEVEYYELIQNTETMVSAETKQGNSFSIPKDCISHFIRVLGELK